MRIEQLPSRITKRPYRRRESDPFYRSPEWRKCRAEFLRAHPHCIVCGGIADTVDHRQQIIKGGAKLDWNNLDPYCPSCHARKSQREAQAAKREKGNKP